MGRVCKAREVGGDLPERRFGIPSECPTTREVSRQPSKSERTIRSAQCQARRVR
jgi:hypothetical protein